MEYLLAHDVGTSGDKAVILTVDGRVLATAYDRYPTRYPQPLRAEQDPDEMWRAVGVTTRNALEASGIRPEEIFALSFSTQLVNVIPVNAQARPLCPAISWLDGRAVEEAHIIMRKLGGPTIFAMLVGVALTGKDLLPKYLWLKRREPGLYAQAAALIDVSGYVLYRATGRLVYEWTAASVTGLFNLKTKSWDTGLMRLFGIDASKFPVLVHSCERIGGLTKEAAAELGLLEGTPVIAGAGDAMSAAVGSGAVGEGEGHLCLGTSGFIGIITSRRVTGKRGIVTLQSADPDKLILIGESETCGECLKWAASELYGAEANSSTFAHMDQDVASTAPGADGLIFAPWMYGERSPVADEYVRASFINLGSNHSRAQMTRAIYEGIAYNLRWILDTMAEKYNFQSDPLRVIGGGARGLPWLRIIADITGRTLEVVPHPQEASAVGAELLAAVGMGVYSSIEAIKPLVPVEDVVKPDHSPQAIYDQFYYAFRRIYRSLRGIYHALNKPEAEVTR